MSNWWVDSFPASVPGGTTVAGGGYGTTDALTARNGLDAKRMAAGFAPGASYPDGYLGSVTDRQSDKLAVMQTRLTGNSYQRGVHKGERADPQSYFWNDAMNPEMGLARQAASVPTDVEGAIVFMSQRSAPAGDPVELLAHDGKTGMMDPRQRDYALSKAGGDPSMNPVTVIDPTRRAQMAKHLPTWSGAFQA